MLKDSNLSSLKIVIFKTRTAIKEVMGDTLGDTLGLVFRVWV